VLSGEVLNAYNSGREFEDRSGREGFVHSQPAQAISVQPRPDMERLGPHGLRWHAPAKINLNLLVQPASSSGYHPLDSYVAQITFYDELDVSLRSDGVLLLEVQGLDCCGPSQDNLVLRAARMLMQRAQATIGGTFGADLLLRKHIPAGAGLGGGSSDAAAALRALNALWRLNFPDRDLQRMAASLGADVPLFLTPTACRMRGYGERVEPVDLPEMAVLLVTPELHCSTPAVYHAFDEAAPEPAEQLPPETFTERPSRWRDRLVNHLAEPAFRVQPALREVADVLADATGQSFCVTGSGAGLFLLCDEVAEAEQRMSDLPDELAACARVAAVHAPRPDAA
jgi:4-diphosphocytidyl-2-C-methyl-D-erythritol kinase